METVQVLLEHGADILDETWNGITAIHVAIVMGHFEILEHMFSVQLCRTVSVPHQNSTCVIHSPIFPPHSFALREWHISLTF